MEREEEYFEKLEKKENIESKKTRITELRVTVVICKEVRKFVVCMQPVLGIRTYVLY